jgi:adenosine/AMP kinase
MDLSPILIDKPDEINFILGQTHCIETVEDMPLYYPIGL